MPINTPEPGGSAVADVRTTVRTMADRNAFRTPALRAARAQDLEITEPHQVFVLGLDQLQAAAGGAPAPDAAPRADAVAPAGVTSLLTAARPVGWRYLVRGADDVIASAESANGPGGAQQFSHVTEGPFVGATAAALAGARQTATAAAQAFTPQLLQIPALHAVALWLHHDGPDDLLVPLAPFPLDLPTGEPQPAATVLAALTDLAARTPYEPADGTKGS